MSAQLAPRANERVVAMSNGLPVVVVDPGHGGTAAAGGSSPNNAQAANGLLEKDLTLDLARRVAAKLGGRARVVLTREGDTNLSLTSRARVAADSEARAFLSIHLNGFEDANVDGTEVWVAREASERSRRFAAEVLRRVVEVTHARDRGVREADLGVLLPARHDPDTGACLVEAAFLTNAAEAERLTGEAYREELAGAMAEGVAAILPSAGGNGAVALPQAGPAAATVIEAVGLGYEILRDAAATSDGDVKWLVEQMHGLKHPFDDEKWATRQPQFQAREESVGWWLKNGWRDEISASFLVKFRYNGHSVGDISIENSGTEDAAGWGLYVTAHILPAREAYQLQGKGPFAAVEVTFNFNFNRKFGDDVIRMVRLVLYGDGSVARHNSRLQ
jgi:N-acetylmuramoyl-L-alanine amidase